MIKQQKLYLTQQTTQSFNEKMKLKEKHIQIQQKHLELQKQHIALEKHYGPFRGNNAAQMKPRNNGGPCYNQCISK